MAQFTNAGLMLLATALQTPGANVAIAYVAIGAGCGALASGLTNGNSYSSLSLAAGLPVALAGGATLTITDGVNSQSVTVTSAGATIGATSIPVTLFVASYTFAATTTGVAPTPAATDLALYNEIVRAQATPGVAGANPGESLNNGYFDGTQPTNVYMQVGYFGGSAATGAIGSGTLIAEDLQFWAHVQNNDSASFQLDNQI